MASKLPKDIVRPFEAGSLALNGKLLLRRCTKEGFPCVCDDTVRNALHRLEFAYLRPKHDLAHKQDPMEVERFKNRLRAAEKKWMRIPA